MEKLSADSLIIWCKIILVEYGLPKKLTLDKDTNFISERFRNLCQKINIYQAASSLYYYQGNGQVELHIKLIKHAMKLHKTLALLKIRPTSIRLELPNPTMLLFNKSLTG